MLFNLINCGITLPASSHPQLLPHPLNPGLAYGLASPLLVALLTLDVQVDGVALSLALLVGGQACVATDALPGDILQN